jgi:hypothetical protein
MGRFIQFSPLFFIREGRILATVPFLYVGVSLDIAYAAIPVSEAILMKKYQ